MARNRMISPEYWQDEKTGTLSILARLLFIGLLNIADDYGVLRGSCLFIRSQILPYDDISIKEIEKAIQEMKEKKIIKIRDYKEQKYIYITNFEKHQTINRKSKKRCIPEHDMKIFEYSVNIHGVLTDQTETETETEIKTETETEEKKTDSDFLKISEKLKNWGWKDSQIEKIKDLDLEKLQNLILQVEGSKPKKPGAYFSKLAKDAMAALEEEKKEKEKKAVKCAALVEIESWRREENSKPSRQKIISDLEAEGKTEEAEELRKLWKIPEKINSS